MLRVHFVQDGEGGFRVAHPQVRKEQRRGIHWLALAQPFQLLQRSSCLGLLPCATMDVGVHHQAPGRFIRAAPLFEIGEGFREQSLLHERERQDVMRLQEVRLHFENAAHLRNGTVVVA